MSATCSAAIWQVTQSSSSSCRLMSGVCEMESNTEYTVYEKTSTGTCTIDCSGSASQTTHCSGKGTCDATGGPHVVDPPCTCQDGYNGAHCQVGGTVQDGSSLSSLGRTHRHSHHGHPISPRPSHRGRRSTVAQITQRRALATIHMARQCVMTPPAHATKALPARATPSMQE